MTWEEVWTAKGFGPSEGSVLAGLMAADGYDTPFGKLSEEAWLGYVRQWAKTLDVGPGTSVFEVGCGAGAFLYDLYRSGCRVSGVGIAPALIEAATALMPEGQFEVCDAAALPTTPAVDVALSCGVFFYFPSLSFAREVLSRMVAKAERAVLILGVPDAAVREQALADRIAAAGGLDAYRSRYESLEHLYYDRDWLASQMAELGLASVQTVDQQIPGYRNGAFRFNAWGYN